MDDEPEILNTISIVLERASYDVFTAASVADAIRVLNDHHIDLVLFDRLPDRGWLTIEARRINPQARLLLCAAGPDGSDLPWLDGVIQKPLTPVELLRTVDEVLHSGSVNTGASDNKAPADARQRAPLMAAVKPQNT
ncbi:MAG: hypothetical protein ACE14M_12685 [Terriglobales bacterium]